MDLTVLETVILGTIFTCIFLLSSWKQMHRKSKLPPGPTPLPLVGNIFQMKQGQILKSLIELSEKYGSVFTIYLGPRPVVVLCGYDAIKEALVDLGEEFSGRGQMPLFQRVLHDFGIVLSSGDRWKQMRRFSLMTLRNFGMGKRSIEERVQEEAQFLVEELKKMKESPFDPQLIFNLAVSNVICSIVFHDRFEYANEKFRQLLYRFNQVFELSNAPLGQMYDMFPSIMKYLPGSHNKIFQYMEEILQFGSERVKINQKSFDPSSTSDFIDCFLKKMEEEKHNPSSEFNMRNLIGCIHNLFFAGTETVSTTLRYGFLILLKYPQIAEKLQEEIDAVIGRNRCPAIEDRKNMPYMDAVIHEIQRYSDLLPMGVIHSVIKDIQFRGFTIPKGTDVLPLLTTVLRDPTQFKDPETFNPGHFLDDKGCFKNHDAFVPFSIGKRICLGEGLARMELFLFFTSILQHFDLRSPIDMKEFDITPPMIGFANQPPPYQLLLTER